MKPKVILGTRLLLGLVFVVFGLNGFLNFLPMPPLPEKAGAMMQGLAVSGYFFPFLKLTEIVCGVLLLLGMYVPLALVVLAPIILNILLFHLVLAPGGLPMAIVLTGIELFLAWSYKDSFKGVLVQAARAK